MIKKEAITGYEDLEIDLYQDKRLEEKKDLWFESCLHDLDWETGFITIFGKTHQIPRLQAWYADNEVEYTYSGKKLQRHNWNNLLLEIKEKIENITSIKFNSVLANLYRDGNDSMGFHSDDEEELGSKPIIASISLGENRPLIFKHKKEDITHRIEQNHGDIILMTGNTQQEWKHGINKSKKITLPRINLTFRTIITR